MFFGEKISGKRTNQLKRLKINKREFGIKNAYNILYISNRMVMSEIRGHTYPKIGNKESAR